MLSITDETRPTDPNPREALAGGAEVSLIGHTLNQYRLLERIGRGGMSKVYRAVQESLGREVAVKVLSPVMVAQEGFVQRFENEARIAAQLDHPNILPIFDYGVQSGLLFLAMPLVRGGTMKDRLAAGPMELPEVEHRLGEVANALQHAHQAGIVHRDLKPTNLLMHPDGRCLLSDFGLARTLGAEHLTVVGEVIGTPAFMAPEQILGLPTDQRVDIYALGLLLFQMLTGTQPFRGDTAMACMLAAVNDPPPSASARNGALPTAVDKVLAWALAKDPTLRPATTLELLQEYRIAVRGGGEQSMSIAGFGQIAVRPAAEPTIQCQPLASPQPFPDYPSPSPTASTFQYQPPAPAPQTPFGHQQAPPQPPQSTYQAILETPTTPPPPSPESWAVPMLEKMGVPRRQSRQGFLLNSYFDSVLRAARRAAGERWSQVSQAAGLGEYLNYDPLNNGDWTTPAEHLSRLNGAFEQVFGSAAPGRLSQWGRLTTEAALRSPTRQMLRYIPGQERRMAAVLKALTEDMNQARGERLHFWKQIDRHQFWLVHFSNPYALGRRRSEKSCHIWMSILGTTLHAAGLLNDWMIEEIECGSVTGTFDCVFAIRTAKR